MNFLLSLRPQKQMFRGCFKIEKRIDPGQADPTRDMPGRAFEKNGLMARPQLALCSLGWVSFGRLTASQYLLRIQLAQSP